jgi:hypothetical protein
MAVAQYCTATVGIGKAVHLGRVVNGVCYSVCTCAGMILPVQHQKVDCQKCLAIMAKEGLKVNVAVIIK